MSTNTSYATGASVDAKADPGRRSRWADQLAARYRDQGRARNLRRDGLIVSGWTVIAGSVALFLADHGPTYVKTFGGLITAYGIIAGLVATASMCLMLILSARVPLIDRTIGQDRAMSSTRPWAAAWYSAARPAVC